MKRKKKIFKVNINCEVICLDETSAKKRVSRLIRQLYIKNGNYTIIEKK